MDQIPNGINCNVIFFPLDYNQEDALIINRASIDAGLFVSDSTRTYDSQKNGNNNENYGERFELPKKGQTFGMNIGSYKHIKKDGVTKTWRIC